MTMRCLGLLMAPVLAIASGCVDGYPTQDEPMRNAEQMTPAELLAKLNDLGGAEHQEARWRFQLAPDCVLAVSARQDGKRLSWGVPLAGMVPLARLDKARGVYQVHAQPASPGVPAAAPAALLVFETPRLIDSALARSVLFHLARGCTATTAPTRPPA